MWTPLSANLALFLLAAVLLYGGTQLLFRALGSGAAGRPLLRGVLLALPVIGCAAGLAACGHGPRGLAISIAAAAVMLTLGTGVIAVSGRAPGGTTPLLRSLPPLAAAVALVGFSGHVTVVHGVLIALVAGVLLWARPREGFANAAAAKPRSGLLAVVIVVMLFGATATVFSVLQLGQTVPISVTTPAIVLMLVVAALGLLATEAQTTTAAALETVVGYVFAALGIAVPLTIFASFAFASVAHHVAIAPATQPTAETAALLMPLPTWRIDSLLLVVMSLYLVPAGFGRAKLGRLDGYFLVTVGVAFVLATVSTLARLI